MNLLDYDNVRAFYNNHVDLWHSDLFSRMTTQYIDKYVNKAVCALASDSLLLNIGSGGKKYNTHAKQVHLDIAENTIAHVENGYVGNIINMPFEDASFDYIICVGTVINYCEADKGIAEISRVSKDDSYLILEYERSGSGLVEAGSRNSDLIVFDHLYFEEPHRNLLYSDSYIQRLLLENGYVIERKNRFNTTIPLLEMFTSENFAHRMTVFESVLRNVPYFNDYSHNQIMICRKAGKHL